MAYNPRYFLQGRATTMTDSSFSATAAFIWSVADLLRGDFKQSYYSADYFIILLGKCDDGLEGWIVF